MDMVLVLIGVAWLAIAAMLLWGLVDGLRKVLRNRELVTEFPARPLR